MFIQVVRATVRMKKGVEVWKEKRKIHERIMEKVKQMKVEAVMQGRYITDGR
jgi:hypothetical protein